MQNSCRLRIISQCCKNLLNCACHVNMCVLIWQRRKRVGKNRGWLHFFGCLHNNHIHISWWYNYYTHKEEKGLKCCSIQGILPNLFLEESFLAKIIIYRPETLCYWKFIIINRVQSTRRCSCRYFKRADFYGRRQHSFTMKCQNSSSSKKECFP